MKIVLLLLVLISTNVFATAKELTWSANAFVTFSIFKNNVLGADLSSDDYINEKNRNVACRKAYKEAFDKSRYHEAVYCSAPVKIEFADDCRFTKLLGTIQHSDIGQYSGFTLSTKITSIQAATVYLVFSCLSK